MISAAPVLKVAYNFEPNFSVLCELPGLFAIEELEQEVGVYSATPDFVRENCGPIANMVLSMVPQSYYDEASDLGLFPNVDVRIHRLYPGDFPAYPGWHCDGEYRETYFSQPDLNRIKVSKHLTWSGSSHPSGVSNTQFLDEQFQFSTEKVDSEHVLWGQVHKTLESQKREPKLVDTKDGQLMSFDSWTLHRAMPAKIRGWRIFFRMAMWHKPNLGAGGVITKQEQVYTVCEGKGW